MLLVDGIFLNSLGGRLLLSYLVDNLERSNADVYYLIDERSAATYINIPEQRKTILHASVRRRHLFYRQHAARFDTILCFANFAPTIRTEAKVYCYYHNVFIFDTPLRTPKERLVWNSKANVLKFLSKNADYYIFQTRFVKDYFRKRFNYPDAKCLTIPFYVLPEYKVDRKSKEINKYLYISDAYGYKNHKTLFDAWAEINKVDPKLELHITISQPEIVTLVNEMSAKGVNIVNHRFLQQERLNKLYEECAYFIFPSLIETMGIGLLESVKAGCELLIADLPYSRNLFGRVITPVS